MKPLLAFALLIGSTVSHAQVFTSVATFSPVLGVRYYPTMEIAEVAAPIEARFACQLPTAMPQCDSLASIVHYGVFVAARSADPSVRAYEVTVKFTRDGKQESVTDYISNGPNGGSKTIWIGHVKSVSTSVVPLKAAE